MDFCQRCRDQDDQDDTVFGAGSHFVVSNQNNAIQTKVIATRFRYHTRLSFIQSYQKINGEMTIGAKPQPIQTEPCRTGAKAKPIHNTTKPLLEAPSSSSNSEHRATTTSMDAVISCSSTDTTATIATTTATTPPTTMTTTTTTTAAGLATSAVELRVDCSSPRGTPPANSPCEPLSPVLTAPAPVVTTAQVIILTFNDVYELFPNANGQGGAHQHGIDSCETHSNTIPC